MTSAACGPILLAIDTAGSACSAAVTQRGAVLASERRAMRHGHGEALLPMIERVTAVSGLSAARIDIVAAATGPGGFTGIRVGLAAAHGIALATGARLLGITSFAAVASRTEAAGSACQALLVALDSRREDLYVQVFGPTGSEPLAAPQAVLPERLADYLAALPGLPHAAALLLAGDAAAAAAAALQPARKTVIAGDAAPDALGVAAAALRLLRAGTVAGPARPFYLRPPDVTLPTRPPVAAASP